MGKFSKPVTHFALHGLEEIQLIPAKKHLSMWYGVDRGGFAGWVGFCPPINIPTTIL
jgi:hypothetical protein